MEYILDNYGLLSHELDRSSEYLPTLLLISIDLCELSHLIGHKEL